MTGWREWHEEGRETGKCCIADVRKKTENQMPVLYEWSENPETTGCLRKDFSKLANRGEPQTPELFNNEISNNLIEAGGNHPGVKQT